ncbi:MarR family winged helix-turn-helix transcriptional regulator [Dysgonomonas sp. Marseille-P4361]|uniref:MarR family winged helix-turn-helix transcriptional regulator n=1 Tax=Dysgonomonas sp. Marseille-P4361 TaxID=2161820 RepID=UPI000D55BB82|nr:MarR family transcriptional regulator [Dysgonomonas sp. Marseille-P4361]
MFDELKLNNQLCFPTYALSRQITNMYRPHLEKLGLTYPQYLVLMVLWEYKQVTIKCLGELLWLDTGTLTPLLKRMEASKLLIRKRSEDDERVVNVSITTKGQALEKDAKAIPSEIKKELKMTDSEVEELREHLKYILSTISKNK